MQEEYQIAVNSVENETVVNRSRFICYLSPCSSSNEAKNELKKYQQLHPQASHHCYAFLTGAPDDSQLYGFSDDGEPKGTAGRPMLSVLQGGNIGQVCAVTVRYFGGTKLGTGGLQRAYGNSVRQALTFLQSETKIPMVYKTLACQYTQIDNVLHILAQIGGAIVKQSYCEQVELVLEIPHSELDTITQQLLTVSSGQLILKAMSDND